MKRIIKLMTISTLALAITTCATAQTPGQPAAPAVPLTWTLATQNEIGYMNSVAYGNGKFVALDLTDDSAGGRAPTTKGRIAYFNLQE